jgi:RNA polymerase sigma-70 factor, ECF subfamily
MATEMGSSQERFASLFNHHYTDVLRYARRRVRPDDAQEIVAETFLIAWRRIDDTPDDPLPWLYRIAALEIANAVRKNTRRLQLLERIQSDLKPVTAEVDSEIVGLREGVGRAFSRLKEDDQEVLRLSAWEGLSPVDAAKVLGCTAATYRVRLHRARRRLEHGMRGESMNSSENAITERLPGPQPKEGAS